MKIIPLAAESMGCRSMATFIETRKMSIIIDPGAGLGELRLGFEPHSLEKWILEKHLERIILYMEKADVIIISHFHFNHYIFNIPDLYKEKILLMKNPNSMIGISQRNQAFEFLNFIRDIPDEIIYVDDRVYKFEDIQLKFSEPVKHSGEKENGYVIMVCLREKEEEFLFIPDIEVLPDTVIKWIVDKNNPDIIYTDGPITYFYEDTGRDEIINNFIDSFKKIIRRASLSKIIIDHHIVRDIQWRKAIKSLLKFSRIKGVTMQTAAEFRGEENNFLEARRDELYK
ncbi:MAG: hypothetical protein R6V04_00095 [bacterium]